MNEAIINQVEEFLRLCADRAAGRQGGMGTDSLRQWAARAEPTCSYSDTPTEVLGRLLLQLPIGTTFTIKG